MVVYDTEDRLQVDGLRLRLRIWRQRSRLDLALAEGADPADEAALALRARQLTRPAALSAIAGTIKNLLDAAEEPPRVWGAYGPRPPLQRAAVVAARSELLALANRLRNGREISPQAAALALRMVCDSASPVYAPDTELAVSEYARAVIEVLGSGPQSTWA